MEQVQKGSVSTSLDSNTGKRYLTSESSDEIFEQGNTSPSVDYDTKTFQKARAFFSPKRNKVNVRSGEAENYSDGMEGVVKGSQAEMSSPEEVSQDECSQPKKVNRRQRRRQSVTGQTTTLHDYGIKVGETGVIARKKEAVSTPPRISNNKRGAQITSDELKSPNQEMLTAITMETMNYEDFKRTLLDKNDDQSTGADQTSCEGEAEMDILGGKPQSISIEMVWQMFAELKEARDQSQKEVQEEVLQKCQEAAKETVSSELDKLNIPKLTKELLHYRHKTDVLTQICDSMMLEIKDLTQKVENLEVNNAKKSVIITGLSIRGTKKEDIVCEVADFLDQALGISVEIENAYTMGSSNPKPIVVEFQTGADKRMILNEKSALKYYRSNNKIFINDFVSLATQEKRRREKKVIADVKLQNQDATVEYTKAGLTIQGTPYRKKVTTPTPSELVNMSVKELDKVLHIKTRRGPPLKKDGSIFYAFHVDTNNHQEVRDAYKKIKLTQPNARHIPCAYSVPGCPPNANDFCDDGEPGSGRVILNIIEEQGWEKCAIFVVRIYGGVKIGGDRFGCYEQATQNLMDESTDHPSPTSSLASVQLPPRKKKVYQTKNEQNTNPKTLMNPARPHNPNQRRQLQRSQTNQHRSYQDYFPNRGRQSVRGTRGSTQRGGYQRSTHMNKYVANSSQQPTSRYEQMQFEFANPTPVRQQYPSQPWSERVPDDSDVY